jgi:drug/metabolite transporter (DMT)-like permease
MMSTSTRLRLAPYLMVVLWSTSWVIVKFVSPYADPLTFVALRFEFTALAAVLIAYAVAAVQPANLRQLGHMLLSGVLMYAINVAGMWWAIVHGLPLAISAVIAATQPLMSAALGPLLGERTTERQWFGVIVGFCGVVAIISPELFLPHRQGEQSILLPLLVTFVAILSITIGTFHQKYYIRQTDLRTLVAYQYIGALMVMFPAAWLFEPMYFELQAVTTLALAWSVLGLSILSMMLYLFLTRNNSVTKVASLIYLIPPIVAAQGYVFFGETLSFMQLLGMALAAAGVYLATRRPRAGIVIKEG